MSGPVRLAGAARRRDGALATWTLAEGRKGRRLREVLTDPAGIRWSLLYETDIEGRFAHLELASPAGLATLHPEGDATLHGNVVEPAGGVRHIVGEPFPTGMALLVADSLLAGAAVARKHRVGDVAVVLDPVTLRLERRALAAADLPAIDADGVPIGGDITAWPLER